MPKFLSKVCVSHSNPKAASLRWFIYVTQHIAWVYTMLSGWLVGGLDLGRIALAVGTVLLSKERSTHKAWMRGLPTQPIPCGKLEALLYILECGRWGVRLSCGLVGSGRSGVRDDLWRDPLLLGRPRHHLLKDYESYEESATSRRKRHHSLLSRFH